MTIRWQIAALLLAGAGAAAQAPLANDSAQRREMKRADLAGAPGMEVVASIAEYKPGESIARHLHHGIESAYVVQGATVQPNNGAPPIVLATGASLLNLRDVPHGGFKVTGSSALILYTVHIVDKGKPLYDEAAQP